MTTKDRILDKAVQLFNESGTGAVSTNHIAEALGMSPGNLYYHFRNKDEIIRAIMDRLVAAWAAIYSLPDDRLPTLEDLQRMVRQNFEVLWQFRFYYREMTALMHRDAQLRHNYQTVRHYGFTNFRRLVEGFEAAGVMRAPVDPAEMLRLTELCWLIGDFWLPFAELGGETVDTALIEHGIDLMMHVLQPYLITPGEPHE